MHDNTPVRPRAIATEEARAQDPGPDQYRHDPDVEHRPLVPIKAFVERVPGGMMIVPLFVGAVIHTLFPTADKFFGSFTGALLTGSLNIRRLSARALSW